jgi:hypothetical protein
MGKGDKMVRICFCDAKTVWLLSIGRLSGIMNTMGAEGLYRLSGQRERNYKNSCFTRTSARQQGTSGYLISAAMFGYSKLNQILSLFSNSL